MGQIAGSEPATKMTSVRIVQRGVLDSRPTALLTINDPTPPTYAGACITSASRTTNTSAQKNYMPSMIYLKFYKHYLKFKK